MHNKKPSDKSKRVRAKNLSKGTKIWRIKKLDLIIIEHFDSVNKIQVWNIEKLYEPVLHWIQKE